MSSSNNSNSDNKIDMVTENFLYINFILYLQSINDIITWKQQLNHSAQVKPYGEQDLGQH